MDNSNNGGCAVITGASSGIGRELVKQFAIANFQSIVAAEDAGLAAAHRGIADPGTVKNG
jgi:NAD(P)-dependent dehydrogenase (short-subunit alcohol dehydrogenase family)